MFLPFPLFLPLTLEMMAALAWCNPQVYPSSLDLCCTFHRQNSSLNVNMQNNILLTFMTSLNLNAHLENKHLIQLEWTVWTAMSKFAIQRPWECYNNYQLPWFKGVSRFKRYSNGAGATPEGFASGSKLLMAPGPGLIPGEQGHVVKMLGNAGQSVMAWTVPRSERHLTRLFAEQVVQHERSPSGLIILFLLIGQTLVPPVSLCICFLLQCALQQAIGFC